MLKEEKRKGEELEKIKKDYNELVRELEKEKEKSRGLQLKLNEVESMLVKFNEMRLKTLDIEKQLNEERTIRINLEEEIKKTRAMISIKDEEIRYLRKHVENIESKLKIASKHLSDLLEERILNYLVIHKGVLNLRKCADEFSISEDLLKEVLKTMQEKGLIKIM
ncbi:MAG: hypothetical protein QW534_06635 [Candidatus Methanomethylicia archaeon]